MPWLVWSPKSECAPKQFEVKIQIGRTPSCPSSNRVCCMYVSVCVMGELGGKINFSPLLLSHTIANGKLSSICC